jgi:protein kinase C substrate 80K-H
MLLVALVVMSTALLGLTRPAAAAAAAAPRRRVRGVAPELAARYAPSKDGTWQCLDGSRVLPSFTRVNDDFCDCPDGSDEPGTSACPGGKFFCANRGHEGRTLSAAFVDDGVCGEWFFFCFWFLST